MARRCQDVLSGLMELKAGELYEVLAWTEERQRREEEGMEEDCRCPRLRVSKEVIASGVVAGCAVVVPFHLPQDVAAQSEICSPVREAVRNWR